jgi:dihydrofolate synthase/folylpolyglutamate synthase
VALTYFEFGTLAAWEVFSAAQAQFVILEVGLGGRLDMINVYDIDVAVVTGIALDPPLAQADAHDRFRGVSSGRK